LLCFDFSLFFFLEVSNIYAEARGITQELNDQLRVSTYIAGNHLTVADLVTFAELHSYAQTITVANAPNVLRWFDLIQNTAVKGNAAAEKEFSLVTVDLDNVPEPVITVAVSFKSLILWLPTNIR
jgi:hypothetical protein